ncbi:unnamed protein product [Adineta ricciae]|uniref:Actin n=2 Tax=Adineta ricciae TaxID=249248 RepID=A0A815P309_ADIRI|nr:unnamed protein product [Adineta ricciae]
MMSFLWNDDISRIVVDIGSGNIQAGFAGDDAPRAVVPNIIGCWRRQSSSPAETGQKDSLIGDELLIKKEYYKIRYPIEHGIVSNWDDMEMILDHIFRSELHIRPEEHPVLLSEPSLNPIGHRERMTQLMFEQFKTPGMYIAKQGVLSFYALGRTSGIVIESGDGVTQTIPICEGYAMHRGITRSDLGGRDLTNWMARLLAQRGYSFATAAEREIVRDMKEKHSYIALDYDEEMTLTKRSRNFHKSYQLPDGQEISISNERFQCPEALFNPKLMGEIEPGIADLVYNAIMNCDIDIRRDMFCNILMSGGNTMFPGIADRMKKELTAKAPPSERVRVVAAPDRKYSAWIGGSILASLSTFQKMWISKEEMSLHQSNEFDSLVIDNESYVGNEALAKRDILTIRHPIEHSFAPKKYPILLTVTLVNPKANREKITRILFEQFNVPSLYMVYSSVLFLYFMGKTNGLILEIDDGHDASAARPSPSGGASGDNQARKRLFSKELRNMMYGFGDDPQPYAESVELLEDLVIQYITDMTLKASEIGSNKQGRMVVNDILYLLRHDPRKYARVKELLSMNEELKRARKAFDEPSKGLE